MSGKVTAAMCNELRKRTGVGMSKCKEALEQANADMERAIDILRKAGIASAVKKAGRETREGLIGHAESRSAIAIVEVNAETDFVTQNEQFRALVKELSQEAAERMPSSLQTFVQQTLRKDPQLTIDEYRAQIVLSLGENIQIKRLLVLSKGSSQSLGVYSHMGGKIVTVVILEGAAGQEALAREIAMHVAAESPDYLRPEEVPAEVKAREEEIARAQIQGKPANVVEKIVEGKLRAFYDQACLLQQKYVKDSSLTVGQLLTQQSQRLGKPLSLVRFIRWKVGD